MSLIKEDVITVDSWRNIPEESWEGQDLPRAKFVYVIPERLAEFFSRIEQENCTTPYIVISAESDYGLTYQSENPVNADMTPWLQLSISQRQDKYLQDGNYEALSFPPRCIPENCRFTDQFSMKCAMFTHSTFPRIPDNVIKLLTTNTDIVHEKVVKIPFGIQASRRDEIVALHDQYFDLPKLNKLYVNFTAYTMERHGLMVTYGNRKDDFVIVEKDLPWQDYISNMAKCQFVLCPHGNGIDCYRNLEAHYMGCAPVMRACTASELIRVPHFEIQTLFGLTEESLQGFETINISDWARLSCWKKAIYDCR